MNTQHARRFLAHEWSVAYSPAAPLLSPRSQFQFCFQGVPLGFRAVQERLGELLAENEGEQGAAAKNDQEGAKDQERGQDERGRALTWQELEEVVVRACLVPVGGVPSAEQVGMDKPPSVRPIPAPCSG